MLASRTGSLASVVGKISMQHWSEGWIPFQDAADTFNELEITSIWEWFVEKVRLQVGAETRRSSGKIIFRVTSINTIST
jgi:hypothetical protein